MGIRLAAVSGWTLAVVALVGCESGQVTILDAEGFGIAAEAIHGAQAAQPPALELEPEVVTADPRKGAGAKPPADYIPMTPQSRSGPAFGNVVLLFDPAGQVVVPIFIGGTEALSIQLRLAKRRYARPLTHDLLDVILGELDVEMLRAQVDTLQDNVYIGTVVLRRGKEILEIDARPSDAIALAIGNQVPIYVSRKLVDHAGVAISELDVKKPDEKTDPISL
jgi:bifunctional DNase/RNase